MNRDDVIDLLTIASCVDNRQVTNGDIIVWHEHLERYDKDECLDAIMAHQRDSTDYLQPAHVIERVRAKRNDAIDRADPDDRPHMVGLNGVPRDSYGFASRALEDIEYPADWTSEQRCKHYWDEIQRRRDAAACLQNPGNPKLPASAETRSHAMEHIRSVLARG